MVECVAEKGSGVFRVVSRGEDDQCRIGGWMVLVVVGAVGSGAQRCCGGVRGVDRVVMVCGYGVGV